MAQLRRFCWTEPRLPDPGGKIFERDQAPLGLTVGMERADIVTRLESVRERNETADLAFYAYRDLNRTAAEPFLKAALERCPVSIAGSGEMTDEAVVDAVRSMGDESIYDEPGRLAQPDEVWNFGRGDGLEKALLLANILRSRYPKTSLAIEAAPDAAVLKVEGRLGKGSVGEGKASGRIYRFASSKQLRPQVWRCS